MKVLDIANAIIKIHMRDSYLTNMKLNKLVYFAYANALQAGKSFLMTILKCGLSAQSCLASIKSLLIMAVGRLSSCR